MKNIFIFFLIFLRLSTFAQLNDDVYIFGEKAKKVKLSKSNVFFGSNVPMKTLDFNFGLDYCSRIRRFHQPMRGFGYYNSFYCSEDSHLSIQNYYGWNNNLYYNSFYGPHYNPYYSWNNYGWYQPYFINNFSTFNSSNWNKKPITSNVTNTRRTRSSDTGPYRSRNTPLGRHDNQRIEINQSTNQNFRFNGNTSIRQEGNFNGSFRNGRTSGSTTTRSNR